MKVSIAHRLPGRTRLSSGYHFTYDRANKLKYVLESIPGITYVKVSPLTGSILIYHEEDLGLKRACRKLVDLKVSSLDGLEIDDSSYIPLEEKELFHIVRDAFQMRFIMKNFLPMPVRTVATFIRASKFIKKGLLALYERNFNVDVLDATAIGVSLATDDFAAASSIMFLLDLGEKLEDWIFEKSQKDLIHTLDLNVDKVFVVDGKEKYVKNLKDVAIGDVVEVTMGATIPVDGTVVKGVGSVNQSSFTGESVPVKKEEGKTVFAGTVLEEGMLHVKTEKLYNESRMSHIIQLIGESEKNKSMAQKKAESMADSLVKYSFFGAILSYAITRSVNRAKAFLMVDFSCALKLTIPIAVMKAMSQSGRSGVLVKGGKYLESLAQADTIVFDKTGTLTNSSPTVEKIIAFDGYTEDGCLRIAACLEEHFPHSIANAVVDAAVKKDLRHEEMHSETEYIVAHGISSKIDGKTALIGSAHFVFDDEKVRLTTDKEAVIEALKENYSLLYLAYDGELIAVLCIADPVRSDAKETVEALRSYGFTNIAMLTGDGENAARYVAEQLGLDYYRSQVLPEDKADYIRSQKACGRKVVMIGDGINDSVALSGADVGIAMHKGADIAREIADIAIGSDDLTSIVEVVKIAKELEGRIRRDYNKIISLNSLLIALGYFQVISNTSSSFLHNSSTVAIAMDNMKDYTLV
ncbi:MAG: heavy metal translocating P-type ATPase [Peptoniphilus sp.]|nr:heavy metal translocating P-type ATPase [Peptoniphilus sp.]MDY3118439.1 heavy metal translocating P-type ATPase [Peptoniphilus sp.]